MKNKIFIALNKGEHIEDSNFVIIIIAKDVGEAEEIGNTCRGLKFTEIVEIGESERNSQIVLKYSKCLCCGFDIPNIYTDGILKEMLNKL